jgi:hypothetical protein
MVSFNARLSGTGAVKSLSLRNLLNVSCFPLRNAPSISSHATPKQPPSSPKTPFVCAVVVGAFRSSRRMRIDAHRTICSDLGLFYQGMRGEPIRVSKLIWSAMPTSVEQFERRMIDRK